MPYKVVFMGCPDFAVPSLKALVENPDFEVVAVYSMPDKPKGRGRKPSPTPIKEFALSRNLPVNTPSSFRKFPEEIEKLRAYEPDFLVVVAYGLILPQAVLEIPAIAPINVHASLLPKYRGPAPIHYAIMNGDKITGNSIMLMNSKMDEGDIIAVSKIEIEDSDNLESLHDKLSANGAELLIPALHGYATGAIVPEKQNHHEATYTCKISPQLAEINWQKPAREIHNLIRAMCPFPGAWFNDGCERIKVFSSELLPEKCDSRPGSLKIDNGKIAVVCGDGYCISLLQLQRPGKSRLSSEEFLRGYKFKDSLLKASA
ncbi:MAG: methionyl-tRNA formyltransferase [Candidatus Rifleibacteriota bacterium]